MRAPDPHEFSRGKLIGALGVMASMTLMACYGVPAMDASACDELPTLTTEKTFGNAAAYSDSSISCGSGDSTRVFGAHPAEPGTLTLHWTGGATLSVARWTCEDHIEIDCQGPTASGELSFKAYGPQAFAIDGLSEAEADSTEFWVELTPSCGDGFKETFEQCDDGGRESGDGCAENCILEEPQ